MPASSVRAPICILGSGPHGLAMALYLVAADPGLVDDIVVIDPAGEWMSTWESQLTRLEVHALRSPSVHHPGPAVDGLTRFVSDNDLMTTGLPYNPPATDAFAAFARHLVAEAALPAPLAARARVVTPAESGVRIEADEAVIVADRLIIAANPHRRVIPEWVSALLGQATVELAHAGDVDLPALSTLEGERVAVVGAGLTAAHLACGAARRGATVELIARRPLEVRDFDTDPGWLGPKHLRAFDAERDPRCRLETAMDARSGGSIPPWMRKRLAELVERGCLVIHEADEVDGASVDAEHCTLRLRSGATLHPDRVWLATGTTPDIAALRCLSPILPDIATVDGFPVIDDDLRVGLPPVHVMGRLATLALGPVAGNLWGARHGAHRITRAITGIDVDFLSTGVATGGGTRPT